MKKMRQRITEEVTSSYRLTCQGVKDESEVDEIISTSQQSINCFVGPLLSVDLINVPGKGQILSLVGHHLVVDIVSFLLILEDLYSEPCMLCLHEETPIMSLFMSRSIPFCTISLETSILPSLQD